MKAEESVLKYAIKVALLTGARLYKYGEALLAGASLYNINEK